MICVMNTKTIFTRITEPIITTSIINKYVSAKFNQFIKLIYTRLICKVTNFSHSKWKKKTHSELNWTFSSIFWKVGFKLKWNK